MDSGEPSADQDDHGNSQGAEAYAIDAMFRTEAPRLVRYFRLRLGEASDPGDLVQETFLRFVGRSTRGVLDNPIGYLHRIARNLLFEQSRRHRVRQAKEAEFKADLEIAIAPSQSYEIEAAQTMEIFQRAVDELPPKTREVFLLHRLDGLTYGEIGERLAISIRTVNWHMTEALFRIRRTMDAQ